MDRNFCSALFPRQRGAALLVFMLLFFLASATFFLKQSNAIGARYHSDMVTADAISQAREALIGRAAIDDDRPGALPCPDVNDTGVSPLLIGNHCPSYIGRLPWKTLRLGDLRDGAGERLWYALAPALRNDDSAEPINSQKALDLTIDGTPNIAAIIFSPGPPLATQNSRPGNNLADYLDGSNNDGDNTYVSRPTSPLFNDTVLAVTRNNLFSAVNRRILGEIRGDVLTGGLAKSYGANGNNYPWAAADAFGVPSVGQLGPYIPHTTLLLAGATNAVLVANAWYPLVTYNVNASRQQVILTINTPSPVSCTITPGQPICQ